MFFSDSGVIFVHHIGKRAMLRILYIFCFLYLFSPFDISAQKVFKVEYESQADKKIFFVDYESQADLKIFIVDYESQAGWRNNKKIHLLRH